ncbi:MAG: mechanosensitive ion channel family protein, partial [Xenococcaceae cyanobacterium MO_167.B52]|nr:mechanosensitive ion channel family protein [Xenococcaceae cyanobacterium MO_167.B52]
MTKFFQSTIKYVIITIFSLTLTLIFSPKSYGQIPLFIPSSNNQQNESLPWDLNKAYPCGKFWCSDIYIYDFDPDVENQRAILTPELTVTALKEPNQSNIEVATIVEERGELVQRVFQQIFEDIVSGKTITEVPYTPEWRFWLPRTIKSLHPWTPQIKVDIENQETVIYVPDQSELGLPSQTIVKITDFDAQANGMTKEELAEAWQSSISSSFSNALWGHELNLQHPTWRWRISAAIMGITLTIIWLIHLIRSFLRKWNHKLRRRLEEFTDALTVDPEATSSPNIEIEKNINDILDNSDDSDDSESTETEISEPNDTPVEPVKTKVSSSSISSKLLSLFQKQNQENKWLVGKFNISAPKRFLQHQTLIKQKRNFCQLLLRLMLNLEIFLLAVGLTIIVYVFRTTRFFSIYLIRETIILIFLWSGLILVDKLGDFIIDYWLNRWASEAQLANSTSNRHTLRANTYSRVLKRGTSFFITTLGLYVSIWLLGFNPSVLASAGVVAVAIAFLSRSLLEDIISGIVILSTDRYALGDVVDFGGGMAGSVEDITLFVTSLRNLDGQLISIPNRNIESVINNTKNWSRVNFTIRIAWKQDINNAIKVMTEVATKMQSEPLWQEKFLEPAEILGVDEISY